MGKVLVTAHLGRHFRVFGHYDYKVLLELGYEVHIAANFNEPVDNFEDERVIKHQIDFARNPYDKGNIQAYKQLVELFEENHFDLIHTQSPSGGAVTRLAAKETRKRGTKVVYTAHGFHFFKGAPKKNWLVYYTIEKLLSKITDVIITINEEDYVNALKKMNAKEVKHIQGVGIDLDRFPVQSDVKKCELREKYNFRNEDFILIYAGELSYRKQQDLIIKAVANLKGEIPNLRILLAGTGDLEQEYKKLARDLNVEHIVQFLGYRNDIPDLMMLSDVAISASRQEGLPVNVMEAMATGLPLIVTDCRGNRDLVHNNINGFVLNLDVEKQLANSINILYKSVDIREKFKKNSLETIGHYSIRNIKVEMKEIYRNL